MKRLILILLTIFMFAVFISCSDINISDSTAGTANIEATLNEQTLEQLGIYESNGTQETNNIDTSLNLRYDGQTGMWFTYMNYADILKGKTESEFTSSIKTEFENAALMGINTVYIHVRAFGDSYYRSGLFPKGTYYDTEYDPLKIMTDEAHKLELSVHAWVNPLRCQNDEELKKADSKFLVKKWCNGDMNGKYIVNVGDTWYLNPAYTEVREYIAEGIKEIAENYDVDGFQIDDYFYPAKDESFDADAFAESGSENLSEWRRENINSMIREIYDTVKKYDLVLGISPQGNINADINDLYADVEKWLSEPGYCDYILPQIYYGFDNDACPFRETVSRWQSLNSGDVKLCIGLCTYKIGKEDKWAGTGSNEWIENRDLVSEQIEYCADNELDISIYSYESTFSDDISEERELIAETINQNYGGDN